jgi:adenosylcobinamide-GDP ribazoletransferase
VAGSVAPAQLTAATLGVLALSAGLAWTSGIGLAGPTAVAAGVGAALLLLARCTRRFGGITGDVLGALVETATTVALVVLAIRVS